MVPGHKLPKKAGLAGISALFGILAGLVLWSGTETNGRPVLGSRAGGEARLISMQQFPEMDGEICLLPARAATLMAAALSPAQGSGAAGKQLAPQQPRGWIFGAVEGSDWGETAESSEASFVGVWSIHDNGDVPPRWTIGGPHGILRQARGVALDVKNKTVIISDKALNGVLSFEFPELF